MSLDGLYAHSLPNEPQDQWQKLGDHLHEVAAKAAEFAEAFESADWAHNAAWLHDFGRADGAFQAYLLRENGMDDSASFGTAPERSNMVASSGAWALLGHSLESRPCNA